MRIRPSVTTVVTYCVLAMAGTVPIMMPTHLVSQSARAAVPAEPVDLTAILGDSGFESDLAHSQWKVTKATTQYLNLVPVNPVIEALDPAFTNGTKLPALTAAAGDNFIGVLNSTRWDSLDLKGKLVHDPVARHYEAGTVFKVTVWGNRGRLATNTNTDPSFPASPSSILIEFCGWGAGNLPFNKGDDNWTKRPIVKVQQLFTNWGTSGEWTSQEFQFTTADALEYVSFTIAGRNDRHDSYVAFDMAPSAVPAVVPPIDDPFD